MLSTVAGGDAQSVLKLMRPESPVVSSEMEPFVRWDEPIFVVIVDQVL